MPGGTVEELNDALVVRRADGRKLPLAEARLAQALRSVGTVRAEEVLLSVPGGRSATALVNATPIRSADGAVESLVVTMQDMAPLQELERLRAEFLGMVSHELRAPLTSISASACPSARGWWRRTAAASGPRAAEPGRAPGHLPLRAAEEEGAAAGLPRDRPRPAGQRRDTELTARVRAALRGRAEPEPFLTGDLAIDYERRRVTVAGRPVRLTATEYELLRILLINAGRVTTYDTLLRQVWGRREADDTELVRTFIKKLRRRLGDDAASPSYIQTERGVGYRMLG